MEHRFQYLRDQNGQPVGCVAIKLDESNSSKTESATITAITFQLSVLNPEDRFDRSLARSIAMARLGKSPKMVMLVGDKINMHVITSSVMKYIAMGRGVPSRATKAAKLWLKNQAKLSRSNYGFTL